MQESAEINGLLEKIRELEALNAELKTINAIASLEYKETIQRLYTNLEYVVSNNARSLNDASKANVRRAQATIQRMKLLSDDISHFLQLHDCGIHKTMMDPNPVLDGVIFDMKGKLEQTNTRIDATPLPPMLADPLLFSILLVRLLDNAIKFRKLTIPPLIRIHSSPAGVIKTVAGATTEYIVISVADNGLGFPAEETEKVFDLFYHGHTNEKNRGSGIGLAVCRKIMTMHGGYITAEGVPAIGATFECYFPRQ